MARHRSKNRFKRTRNGRIKCNYRISSKKYSLLWSHIRKGKTKWKVETNFGYLGFKHSYCKRTFQNAQVGGGSPLVNERSFFDYGRFNKCLLARSYSPRFPKVSRIPVSKQELCFSGNAVRVVHSTPHIYQNNARYCEISNLSKHSNYYLFRRHIGDGKRQRDIDFAQELNSSGPKNFRLRSKLREVLSLPSSRDRFSRSDVEHKRHDCVVGKYPNPKNPEKTSHYELSRTGQSQGGAITHREPSSRIICSVRSKTSNYDFTSLNPVTKVYNQHSQSSPKPTFSGCLQDNCYKRFFATKNVSIASRKSNTDRSRCFLDRLGGSDHVVHSKRNRIGLVGSQGARSPNCVFRGESHFESSSEFPSSNKATNNLPFRQQGSSPVFKQRRVIEVSNSKQLHSENLDSQKRETINSQREVSCRQTEHSGGHFVAQTPIAFRGMESQSKNFQLGVQSRVLSRGGLIQHRLEPQTSCLLHPVSESSYSPDRCHEPRLEPMENNIPISPSYTNITGFTEGQESQGNLFTGFPRLAEQAMVPDHQVPGLLNQTHSFFRPVAGAPGFSNHRLTQMLVTSQYRNFYTFLLTQIFPDSVAKVIAESIRHNTYLTYATGFRLFQKYLIKKEISIISISVVMQFLSSLLDINQSINSIKVYKSALTNILYYGYGISFEEKAMTQFMRGVDNLGYRPPQKCKWNASAVADLLISSIDNSLRYITQKALFLVLVATGRRINDTLASLRTPHFCKLSPDGNTLIIQYAPSHRFKNDFKGDRPSPITITRYKEIRRRNNTLEQFNLTDELLCPVKATEVYLHATRNSRSQYLFVKPDNIHARIQAREASNLISNLVH